jgi:hypothetical protein
VAGCCECGDEPSGSCASELVSLPFFVSSVFVFRSYILHFPFPSFLPCFHSVALSYLFSPIFTYVAISPNADMSASGADTAE